MYLCIFGYMYLCIFGYTKTNNGYMYLCIHGNSTLEYQHTRSYISKRFLIMDTCIFVSLDTCIFVSIWRFLYYICVTKQDCSLYIATYSHYLFIVLCIHIWYSNHVSWIHVSLYPCWPFWYLCEVDPCYYDF